MQVFTSVLVLSLCFAAFVYSHIKDYKSRKADSMSSIAQVIGANSISAIDFQDNDAVEKTLIDLQKISPEIINATILDTNNHVFESYTKPGMDSFDFSKGAAKKNITFYQSGYLFVYNTIFDNNEKVGTVCFRVELNELAKIKNTQYSISIIILIVGCGLAFLIGLIVQSYISKPLLSLVHIMKEVSKTGEYKRKVSPVGKDEISTLSLVFNDLMSQILESQKRKDEFIGIASHELKTPLTSIKAYLQVIDSIENVQPQKQYVQKALENVNKLQQLIYDLLDVSKIQSGQLHLNVTSFDMDKLIDETIASFQMVSTGHKIIRAGGSLNQVISADRRRIEQVLMNLLSNAIKYSPGKDKVVVHTEKNSGQLVIQVEDFGIGIEKDEYDKIFERFYRTKNNSILISGFGLGLYICRDIMKRHDGKIWVESDAGHTSFYFSLPATSVKSGELANVEKVDNM